MSDVPGNYNWQEEEIERLLEKQEPKLARDSAAQYDVTPANVEYMMQTTQTSIDELRLIAHERPLSLQEQTTLILLQEERASLYELLEQVKKGAGLNQIDDDNQ